MTMNHLNQQMNSLRGQQMVTSPRPPFGMPPGSARGHLTPQGLAPYLMGHFPPQAFSTPVINSSPNNSSLNLSGSSTGSSGSGPGSNPGSGGNSSSGSANSSGDPEDLSKVERMTRSTQYKKVRK